MNVEVISGNKISIEMEIDNIAHRDITWLR